MDEALANTLKIMIPFVIFAAIFMVVLYKQTGGRSFLNKYIQDYGYDDPNTIGMLKSITEKILSREGFDCTNLSLGHEVGNRFVGDFYCKKDGYRHEITIITDGSTVDYRIDGGPTRRYTK